MVLPEYRKLTESELVRADHYAETGNFEGLRSMQKLSASREAGGGIKNKDTRDVSMNIMPTRRNL